MSPPSAALLCDILEDVLEGDFEARAAVRGARQGRPKVDDGPALSLSCRLRGRAELPRGSAYCLNPTSFKTYFKPLRKLLEMNDVAANWKRGRATFPERDNALDGKGWTRDEIAMMLGHARDPMDRAAMLLPASSGVRLGGLD